MGSFRVRHPSPALVVSVIALVVALGGTSYAAFSLPKNSVGTKQLKNGAVTAPKIKNGAVTASKINPTGLTVPKAFAANTANTAGSATNATNATNATHATSADNATNAGHAQTAGSAPLPATLPAGTTLTGTFALRGQTSTSVCPNCSDTQADGISFPIPLATAPTVHVILLGAAVPAGCSGTPANPGASSGNLCIFEGFNFNAMSLQTCEPISSFGCTSGASRFGTGVIAGAATGNGVWDDFGTWAVTG